MADTSSSVPLDGAIAAFVAQVLDELVGQVADDDTARRTLAELGLTGPDVDHVAEFLEDRADDLAVLRDTVPELIAVLASREPQLLDLLGPVKDLVELITGLSADMAAEVPGVTLPALPDAGSILDTLLALAIEKAVQGKSPAGWALAKSLHLLGPELPPFEVLSQVLEAPLDFVWSRFQHLRRHLDITLAGILTGPRTISMVTVPVSPADQVMDVVADKVPDADVVLQRVTLRLAADTYDEPFVLTVDVLGHDTGGGLPEFAAVAVMSQAIAEPFRVSDLVTLHLDPFEQPFGVAVTGWSDVVAVTEGSPQLTLGAAFATGFTFGEPGGIRLELSGPVLDPRVSADEWGLRFGLETFELTIPQDIAGAILALLLPRDGVRLKGKLVFSVDEDGLHAEGGIGLKTTWPDTLRLPGLFVRGLTTEIATADQGLAFTATGTITIDLGVLTVTAEGLGMAQPVELRSAGDGNLGLVELGAPVPTLPTGIGVSIDAVVVKGGGFLRIEEHGVSGALELALSLGAVEVAVRAVGVIESVEGRLSFVIVMSVEFSPPIELFLGLTLNAVGGVFGINRTTDTAALTAVVRSGRMNDVMFPENLAARAVEVIASVKQVFPARVGQVVVGPMLKLGWGRPVSFVTASVGVVLTFPTPVVIAIIGNFRIALPAPDVPVIDMRADFAGTIDPVNGAVSFDASLTGSRIATFDVTGDIALRAGPDGFVFTAGGFFPGFPVPAGLGEIRRLSISIAPSPLLSIRADAYFALTASTVQFGGGLAVVAELGPIAARGHLALDVLIRTEPTMAFTAQLRGQFRLSFEGEDILSADLNVLLEGPDDWYARARASISFLFFSVSGSLELRWGQAAEEPRPSVLVAAVVREALAAPPVWAHVLPAADGGVVTLREGAAALHPLGRLRLTQSVAPLGVTLAHFGSATVTDGGPVQVTISSDLADPEPAEELFAAAQFFDLTDEEKLSKPAFVPQHAGYVLQGTAWAALPDTVVGNVVYEESSGEPRPPAGSRRFGEVDEALLGWCVLGAAGRSHDEKPLVTGSLEGLKVNPTTYAVADAATGAVADGRRFAADQAFAASARHSVDTVAMADYELAGLS